MKLPLEMKSSHLKSVWQVNNSIKAKVFLETGFPKIVINEAFVKENISNLHTEKASKNAHINLWGNKNKIKISYFIKDSLIINGKKEKIDAVVVDFSTIKAWENYDIVYPLRDLKGNIEINIKDKYMIIRKCLDNLTSDFIEIDAKTDNKTKGLYIETTLQIYDTLNTTEKLKGNFLLDLGAANAIFVNKNLPKVKKFVSNSDRMLLKDTTKFKPNPRTELAIIMPNMIQLKNVTLKKNFIVAMKMFKSKITNNYVGMIGNRFFANFAVIFDFKNNKVYMKPNSDKVEIVK